jgi:Zn-dependent protease
MSWSGSFSYTWNPPPRSSQITTSRTEVMNIGIAYAVLTLDIVILFSGHDLAAGGLSRGGFYGITSTIVAVSAGAAFTGFVAHELAHKIAAQRRGFWAEFRLSPFGLLLSLVTATFGFLFAAPGATMVGGINPADVRSWGRTSLAGPMSNAVFAAAFYAGAVGTFLVGSSIAGWLLVLAFINAWFGAFNLIPFGPLDGAKVFRWDRVVWVFAIVGTGAGAILMFLAQASGSPFLWF